MADNAAQETPGSRVGTHEPTRTRPLRLTRTESSGRTDDLVAAVVAIAAAAVVSSGLVLWAGASVPSAWNAVFDGAFGSRFNLLETLVTATPLILTGLAAAVAFRARFYNIGAEGQFYAGAIVATAIGLNVDLRPPAMVPLMIAGGFLGGGLWLLAPALLKLRFAVDEVVTTLLLNFVAIYVVSLLVHEFWLDPLQTDVSYRLAESSDYPLLASASRLHLGFAIAVAAAVLIWLLITYTTLGYKIRAVGSSPRAARFGGIRTTRVLVLTALLSGGVAGIAGAGELLGIRHQLSVTLSAGFGFTGIVVAMLARLNPIGVLPAAIFFAAVINGTGNLARVTPVPPFLGDVIQALILLFMLAALVAVRYRIRRS